MAAALAQLHATLDALGDQPDATVVAEADAVGRAVSEVERLSRRVASLRLRLVACANRSQVARRSGFSTTGAWLASRTHTTGGAATREADLAETLESVLPVTGQALAEGAVSPEHAAVIAWAIKQLPEGLTAEQVARVEASLVADAARMSPARLRGAARRALAVVEPDQQAVDEHEDQVLRGEEASALGRCRLSMHDNSDGTVSGSFVLPRLAGDILRKAVQQLAAPRRGSTTGTGAAGATGDGVTRAGATATGAARSAPAPASGTASAGAAAAADGRAGRGSWVGVDWPHRYGLALVELLEHLPTDRLPGKVAATVVVTMTREQLVADLAAAHLDTGHDISAGDARRLACNAGIVPVVLGGASQPLDLGRAKRFFSEAQRTALATRYDQCAVLGCDSPFAWTELHHEHPWSRGGATDLEHAVPLCGRDHRDIHKPGTRATITTGPDGRKTVQIHRRE
ncbi:HNH endonuclease signature motif containing protein [Barrientosiimonas humi]|uniref:HNH endonuclease signature motif containing protein n=1 Tax=Barrientosiimonas humi TaxID=999931 RepID=UPI001477044C|nr:HNH endonuclease signature motif containing protein [Barrientosiimonas humi]